MVCDTYNTLLDRMSEFEIIDAHEHLLPEPQRVNMPVDVFTLFSHYTKADLVSAGLTQEGWEKIHDPSIPLENRWRLFEPFLDEIRYGSYARPAFMAAKEFCGVDDISGDTYHEISEKLAAHNTAGLYDRILRDKCRIRKAVSVLRTLEVEDPGELFSRLVPMRNMPCPKSLEHMREWTRVTGVEVKSLDDMLAAIQKALEMGFEQGYIGAKMCSHPYGEPDRKTAEEIFARLLNGDTIHSPDRHKLWGYTVDEMISMVGETGRVVAVHTGVWNDFRRFKATHMIPMIQRHPDVRFDLYHGSIPYVREIGFVAKNFPNVWLNLCWAHIVSPVMTRSMLNEWMDYVPMNKIIAFGGDYMIPVEKVYGHLVMARENISQVLAMRVEEELMDLEEAVRVAYKWFHDNPAGLYGL